MFKQGDRVRLRDENNYFPDSDMYAIARDKIEGTVQEVDLDDKDCHVFFDNNFVWWTDWDELELVIKEFDGPELQVPSFIDLL